MQLIGLQSTNSTSIPSEKNPNSADIATVIARIDAKTQKRDLGDTWEVTIRIPKANEA